MTQLTTQFSILNNKTKRFLVVNLTENEAEFALCRFINHGENAFIVENDEVFCPDNYDIGLKSQSFEAIEASGICQTLQANDVTGRRYVISDRKDRKIISVFDKEGNAIGKLSKKKPH